MATTILDANQVIKKVYDEAQERLRVDAEVHATFGDLEVSIDQSEDSILVYGQDGSTVNRPIRTDANGELQVDVLSSALPSGAATEAKQDVGNASLASIDSDIDVALSTRASEATLSTLNAKFTDGNDIGDVTVNNASGAAAVNIQDGGNTITVDGTVNAVQSGTWNINDITGTISLPTGAATAANQTTEIGHLSSIDSDIDVALSTRASESTLSTLNNKVTDDYGVSSAAVRTASQIGNASGAANFNAGATGAQTLRTSSNITRNGNELSYNSGTTDTNTLRVTQATDVSVTVIQPTHDNLNLNANIQVSNTDVSDSNSVPVNGARGTLTDFSGSASTASAQIIASNSNRKYLLIHNLSGTINMWVNFGSSAGNNTAGSIQLGPKDTYEWKDNFIPTQSVHLIAGSGTPTYTAKEGS